MADTPITPNKGTVTSNGLSASFGLGTFAQSGAFTSSSGSATSGTGAVVLNSGLTGAAKDLTSMGAGK